MTVSAPILMAVVAMFLFSFADFALKRAADEGVKPYHSVMVQAWFFSSSMILYAYFSGQLVPVPAALWGAAAGLCMVVGFSAFTRSLMGEPVSIQAPVFRLNFIIAAMVGFVFFGEALTPLKGVALALALLAVWLLLGNTRGAISRRALAQVLVATVAVGLANVLHKFGLRAGALPETLVAAQACVFVSVATLQTLVIEKKIAPPRVAFRYPVVCAYLFLIGFLTLVRGLAVGEASVLVPISQMGFVVTAMLGIVLLGERVTARKIAGLIAAVVSLAAFAW